MGKIHNRTITLSLAGQIVEQCWRALPHHVSFIDLDALVIMPNHLHGIIVIKDSGSRTVTTPGSARNATPANGTQSGSLAALVQNFKSVSTRKINQSFEHGRSPVWQRGYYERVIRDEIELDRIRHYIEANPERWAGST